MNPVKAIEKFRAKRFRFIQENVVDQDNQLAMLQLEIDKIYSDKDLIGLYSDPEFAEHIAYDSFKVKNPECGYEEFKGLLMPGDIDKIIMVVSELEKDEVVEDEEIIEELKITKEQLAAIKSNQKKLYKYLQQNLEIKKKRKFR